MEVIRFLIDNHVIEFLPFAAIMLYFLMSKRIAKARHDAKERHDEERHASNRSTSRTSEYYSTEIDEL